MKPDLTNPTLILSSKIRACMAFLVLWATMLFPGYLQADSSAGSPFQIAPDALHLSKGNDLVILDSRSKWSFLLGHIPGARHLGNWQDYTVDTGGVRGKLNPDKKFIAKKLSELGIAPSKILVIYGDPKDKWRTDGRFFWMFEFLGFQKVLLLEGGYEGWLQKDFPLERGGAQDFPPSTIQPSDLVLNPDTIADQNWIQKRLGKKDIRIIDNRERSEYDGATPYGSPRGGHIPGAIHIDWRDFFDNTGTLKSHPQLMKIFQQYNIHKEQEVVVYCTGGVRSAMAYFVFRVLDYKVRNYDGSWWDWSHSPSLPIETS